MIDTDVRETGATDEQIAAAKASLQSCFGTAGGKATASAYVDMTAPHLVPTGYCIVPVDAVMTDLERSTLVGVLDAVDEYALVPPQVLSRLRRFIERGEG